MQDNRTVNTLRNIVWGVIYGLASVLMPFISRSITLHYLDVNYLGVGTLFTSVLQFLNLFELGRISVVFD